MAYRFPSNHLVGKDINVLYPSLSRSRVVNAIPSRMCEVKASPAVPLYPSMWSL